jgi:calcium-dependent protein kinase
LNNCLSKDHPNIIKIFEFYQDEGFFYIITELCTGGELFDKILEEKSFSEKKAAETFRQILSAVFYCHSHKIVHRFIFQIFNSLFLSLEI